MSSELDLLWDTYDFVLEKVVVLEDEFASLFKQINEQIESLGKINPATKGSFLKNANELKGLYNKQIRTIKELSSFYKKNKANIPPERKVSIDSFEELGQVTEELQSVLNQSLQDVENMLDY